MLQQAYLARKASEDSPFLSFDQKFSQYQKDYPRSTSYILKIPGEPTKEEIKSIALHFSDAGYDVLSTVFNKLEISWTDAKEGRTGKIDIHNEVLNFIKDARYQK